MPALVIPGALRDLSGGRDRIEASGGTIADLLAAADKTCPGLAGRVVDELGRLRPHVKLFVGGEIAALADPVAEDDDVRILPAISGGAGDEVELLVGTRKGLFVLKGAPGAPFEQVVRAFPGEVVEYATKDPRTGTYLVSVTHGQFGPRVHLTDDVTGEWEEAEGPAFPSDAGAAIERTWVIQPGEEDGVLWAGVAPAALFRSEDAGRKWALNRGLWDEPSRPHWQPGAGGMCLHSISQWPGDPRRMAVGISAAGVWLTDDGGASWRRGIEGIAARYLPPEARAGAVDLCVHNLHRSPMRPERLYMQFHGGVYRSDDAGETWIDIGSDGGLPADFGFPLVADPRDPDRAFVIPLKADMDRVTPGGRVAVYETRDAGESWSPLGQGLPESNAYLTILRQAFCHDGRDPLGLYFGAESGEVFAYSDAMGAWSVATEHLAPVTSVRCA